MGKKVLLLEPFAKESEKLGSFSRVQWVAPPIGLLSIYAYLKSRGVDVHFLDYQITSLTPDELVERIKKERYDIIGIPVFTNTAHYSFHTARICKEALPGVLVVFGNVHVSSMPERTFNECPDVDICVIGEGEFTFEEIVTQHTNGLNVSGIESIKGIAYMENGKMRLTAPRPLIKALDDLPSIYESFPADKYVMAPQYARRLPSVTFMTQRGCPFPCSFCEVHVTHGFRTRYKSVDLVIKELVHLEKAYGIRSVVFADSTFTINKKYTMKLCEEMRKANLDIEWSCNTRNDVIDYELMKAMKAAGCWQICYGVESANPESLKVIKKGGRMSVDIIRKTIAETKKAGIRIMATFILCIPGEDEQMVWNTINFAKELAPHTALFFLPVPYPGSELYKTCKETGLVRNDAKWEDYLSVDYDNPVYVNPLIGKKRMKELYKTAFRSFYLSPRIWWLNLKTIRSLDEVNRYLRSANALFGFFSKHGVS